MPRPRLRRRIRFRPDATYFKPAGVAMAGLEHSTLTFDEIEALRLKDYEGRGQAEAAESMNVSQPTFHRLLMSARKKAADALVNGKAIRIEGGDFRMEPAGRESGRGLRAGAARGRRLGGGFAKGPAGECACPKCGHKAPHARGRPCYQQKCPKCGAVMTRG